MSYAVELYFDELGESRVRFAVCDDVDVPLAGKLLERFAAARPPFPVPSAATAISEVRELYERLAIELAPLAQGLSPEYSAEETRSGDGTDRQGARVVTAIGLVRVAPRRLLALAPLGRLATVDERGGRAVQEAVHVVPSDPGWVGLFEHEKEHLRGCLPAELLGRIEHFGSTSVPGLAAKPVVDMLVEVTDLEATRARIVPLLEEQGYDYYWRPVAGDTDDERIWYAWFIKRSRQGERTHHIHMIEGNHPMWEQLRFRDILRGRPALAEAYARLKMSLAETHRNDREAYTNAKGDFIASAMRFVEPFGG